MKEMKKVYWLLAAGGLLLLYGSAQADTIVKPNTFSAGTPADADQVNANFDTVYDQVNKVGAAITVDGANNVGIGTTTPAGELHVTKPQVMSPVVFTGIGQNDIAIDDSGYSGTGTTSYAVRIQNPGPTPNQIEFSSDGGSSWSAPVEMVTSGLDIGNGVTIGFAALGGHTFDDKWEWTVAQGFTDSLIVSDGRVSVKDLTITGGAAAGHILSTDASGNATWQANGVDTGCPGPRINGVCIVAYYGNVGLISFMQASDTCASVGGDLCTDAESYALGMEGGLFDNAFNNTPRWTASSDNDGQIFTIVNGGISDDPFSTTYAYGCCGGTTTFKPRTPVTTHNSGVKTIYVHNIEDTNFTGAARVCSSLDSTICSDSQTRLLRLDGVLSVRTWTRSHSDNDAGMYSAINGGTSDNPHYNYKYGFACCPSTMPNDLVCPVTRTNGVCAVSIHDIEDSTFDEAASACGAMGADLCTNSQCAVLRNVGAISARIWSSSHSDNDAGGASLAVGSMPDNPNLAMLAGYVCVLR